MPSADNNIPEELNSDGHLPRSIQAVAEAAVEEAKLIADDFYWEWEVNEKDRRTGCKRRKLLCGISIDGALSLMRAWRNCTYVPTVESEDERRWRFLVSFTDYETKTTTPRLYEQPKQARPDDYDQERWDAMQFQNGQSRAIRNAIEKSMPTWLVKQCIAAAKESAVEALSSNKTLKREQEDIVTRAKELGLTSAQLKSKTGKNVVNYTPEDVVTVRALLNAIESGEATSEQMFGRVADKKPSEAKPATQAKGKAQPAQAAKPTEAKAEKDKGKKGGSPQKDPKPQEESPVWKLARDLKKAKDEQELGFILTDIDSASLEGRITGPELAELLEQGETARKRILSALKK